MDKLNENKKEKEEKLLSTAYNLFINKGIKHTSIQDIVDNAGVAKGTFYLYFKDKYEIRDAIIEKVSKKLFKDAIDEVNKNYISNFEDQVVFVINYVIDKLIENKILLKFISKDLSFAMFNGALDKVTSPENKSESLINFFIRKSKDANKNYERPEMILFTIIELVSSTCFTSILYDKPVSINEYKPFLYKIIRNILQ